MDRLPLDSQALPHWPAHRGELADLEPPDLALANLQAALTLLRALQAGGVALLVLCPGSRSGPLAVAAGLLERQGLRLLTAIDERSAAFLALGHSRGSGLPAAVITTSGTAVAQLLAAAVEADYGGVPLLLLSADRPERLKGCGANQTVNQETFLLPSVRWLGQGDRRGLHAMAEAALETLATTALEQSLGRAGDRAPGPVHLNLPFEEPLHTAGRGLPLLPGSAAPIRHQPPGPDLAADPGPAAGSGPGEEGSGPMTGTPAPGELGLDPDQPGVIVAGPWRGRPQAWPAFVAALTALQRRCGWPVLADVLSSLRGQAGLELVAGYDLLLADPDPRLQPRQVLRLGPLPASRRLQDWLATLPARQVVISEGDPRHLDPLGQATQQHSAGLASCWAVQSSIWHQGTPAAESLALAERWRQSDTALQQLLDRCLLAAAPTAPTAVEVEPSEFGSGEVETGALVIGEADRGVETEGVETGGGPVSGRWSEPALARQLGRLLPPGLPLVLANSSPVRDWESFTPADGPPRPVLGFRGASGIDGTLSLACGVAEQGGQAVLISGDLALLHDSNGWLWHRQLRGRLAVVLIDNGGGGIFEQLPIRPDPAGPAAALLDFERLFAMPQAVDALALAAAHGVPGRRLAGPERGAKALAADLAWALAQPLALLVARSDRRADADLRRRLRKMAGSLRACP